MILYDAIWCCMMLYGIVAWCCVNIKHRYTQYMMSSWCLCCTMLSFMYALFANCDLQGLQNWLWRPRWCPNNCRGPIPACLSRCLEKNTEACILPANSQRRLHELLRLREIIDKWPHEFHECLVQQEVDQSSPQALGIISMNRYRKKLQHYIDNPKAHLTYPNIMCFISMSCGSLLSPGPRCSKSAAHQERLAELKPPHWWWAKGLFE